MGHGATPEPFNTIDADLAALGSEAPVESTRELIRLAKSGDRLAQERFFERYFSPVRRFAHGRMPARARGVIETDDLVQETLLAAFERLPAFEHQHPGGLLSYLYASVRNRITDEIRRAERRPTSDATAGVLIDARPSPMEQVLDREKWARYEEALEQLSAEDQALIQARFEGGCSYADIAELCDRPSPDAARMAVVRAIERLVRRLADD